MQIVNSSPFELSELLIVIFIANVDVFLVSCVIYSNVCLMSTKVKVMLKFIEDLKKWNFIMYSA